MVYHSMISDLMRMRSDLYNGKWSQVHQYKFELLYNIPVLKSIIDADLNHSRMSFYMDYHNIDWSDVKDPRNLANNDGSAEVASATLNFVSSNLNRLYSNKRGR